MKWKLSLPESPMLVYYWIKLSGLAPFTVKKNRVFPPKLLDVLYPIFVAAAYSFFIAFTLIPELQRLRAIDTDVTRTVSIFIPNVTSFPTVVFTPIIFLLMHKRISNILEKFHAVGIEFKRLRMVEDYGKLCKKILVVTTMTNTVLMTACVVRSYMTINWPWFVRIKYTVDNWFTLNTTLIFSQLLLCIGQRFALLSQKLRDIFTPTRHVGSPRDARIRLGSGNSRNKVLKDIRSVQKLEGLQLDLCELVDETTHLFTAPIIFISLQSLAMLGMYCFSIYSEIRKQVQPSSTLDIIWFVYDNFIGTTLGVIVIVVELLIIAHASATTYEKKNAVRATLFDVWENSRPQSLQDEFYTFDLLLMHESNHISILGFFRLDYAYVYKILCAVLAYAIVIIQFDNSPPNPTPCNIRQ